MELAAAAANQHFWRHDLASGRVEWLHTHGHPFPVDAQGHSDGAAILQATLPEDRAIVMQARRLALQATGVVEAVYRVRSTVGEVRHTLTRRIALRDEDGAVKQMLGVSIDISTERQQQAALQALAQRHALVLATAKMASVRLDLRTWRYHFDSAFASLYGLAEGSTELAWDDWLKRLHPADLPGVRQRVQRMVSAQAEPASRSRFRVIAPDGQLRWIEAHRRMLRASWWLRWARTAMSPTMCAPSPPRKPWPRSAPPALSGLLAGASHELRMPLNAVLGFTHLLGTGLTGPLPDKAQRYLAGIEEAGRLLLRLSDEFSQLAALAAGQGRLTIEAVALAPLLPSALALVEPHALAAGIELALVDDALGVCVLADAQRLRQVLLNLLSTAIKYNRPGPSPEIKAALGEPARERRPIRLACS